MVKLKAFKVAAISFGILLSNSLCSAEISIKPSFIDTVFFRDKSKLYKASKSIESVETKLERAIKSLDLFVSESINFLDAIIDLKQDDLSVQNNLLFKYFANNFNYCDYPLLLIKSNISGVGGKFEQLRRKQQRFNSFLKTMESVDREYLLKIKEQETYSSNIQDLEFRIENVKNKTLRQLEIVLNCSEVLTEICSQINKNTDYERQNKLKLKQDKLDELKQITLKIQDIYKKLSEHSKKLSKIANNNVYPYLNNINKPYTYVYIK